MASEPPKVINVRKKDREVFEKLRDSGPLADREWSEIWCVCLSFGLRDGVRTPLGAQKTFLFRTESVNDSSRLWLVYSAAIRAEGQLEILADKKHVWGIAEEYATTGLKILNERIQADTSDNVSKLMVRDMLRQLE